MFKIAAGCLLVLSLVGCATYPITEKVWMHPGNAVLAPKALRALSAKDGYQARSDYFKTSDGSTLHALMLTRPDARVAVLLLGGDSFQTGTAGLERGNQFEHLGVDAMLLDYPGYGGSEGKQDLAGTRAAVLAAFDHMRALPDFAGKPIVVWGFSMGSVFAPMVAAARPIQGLVLESAATTVKQWARAQVPWYAKPFIRFTYAPDLLPIDNRKVLADWHGPLFLLVGSADKITPVRFSRELYLASATPADDRTLFVTPGQGHGGATDDPAALGAVHAFLGKVAAHAAVDGGLRVTSHE